MRRIFVDDNVRKVADDYAANVFANKTARFKRPKVLLKDFSEKALKRQDPTDGKVLCAYVDELIKIYPRLLHLEPDEMKEEIKRFNQILHIGNGNVAGLESLMNTKVAYKGETQEFYKWIVKSMRYDDVRECIIPYMQKLNIRTCVYCNAQYAVTACGNEGNGKKKGTIKHRAFYELDHFYPKSHYPFLCTNFYNLQPCCSSCNKSKLEGEGLFNLYTNNQGEELNPFLFSVPRECVIDAYLNGAKDYNKLEIKFDAPNYQKLKANHESLFHITALYSAFKDVAEEIIWKRKAWNNSYMKMLEGQYSGMNIPQAVQERLLFGFFRSEKDILLRPLTKLQQDLYRQQDLI